MQSSDLPRRFPQPWGYGAGSSYIRAIPTASQAASASDAPASLQDGFPPATFQPEASGGVPPNGADMNGILNQLSLWARWAAAGGQAVYDSQFVSAIGGYPKGALLVSTTPGLLWQSLVENNTVDPDSGPSPNWSQVTPPRIQQDGTLSTTIVVPNTYTITFPTPFPNVCTGYSITPINLSASSRRDNYFQRVSFDRTGITFVAQGSATGGDNSLDGVDWVAWGH